ncbi:MAG TPA: malto-oligosyltrehalose synthase, partial [Chryseosolibacter sp.]|nr:malto-oligosyltrehalose synthase [Chryseosolibacter sp.]
AFVVQYYDSTYPISLTALESISGALGITSEVSAFVSESKVLSLNDWLLFRKQWGKKLNESTIVEALQSLNNDHEGLKQILSRQYYQLTYWKRSEFEINYRRFFTVNELICLRMEDQHVFDEYHQFIKQLYDENLINGVRIDHIDGLYDPSGYVTRLRNLLGPDCYIIAEKILEAKEDMPEHWPLQGTSGYEFLSYVSQLATEREGGRKLVDFYRQLIPDLMPYNKMVYQNKKLILENYMRGEWDNLFHLAHELSLTDRFNSDRLKEALGVFMLCVPVYRIYPDKFPLREKEQSVINETFRRCYEHARHLEAELRHLESVFTGKVEQLAAMKFLKRVMQFTGPLTAKGVEDTTFYVYNPLISHDEVGDAPSTLGISVQSFHSKMAMRLKTNRFSLNATATHDTKRGEDARLRLNMLSQIPEVWESHVRNWLELNKSLKKTVDEKPAPSLNDEYFIYQSLIGGMPESMLADEPFLERVAAYLTKAIREAKENSNWSAPNEAYEQACIGFVRNLFSPDHGFAATFIPFVQMIRRYAEIYSLSQTLIKITAPGIPDTYQGCTLWDLSFVDPDNRRPVDYPARTRILSEIAEKEREGRPTLMDFLRANRNSAFEKLFVTWKALSFRRQFPSLFAEGEYVSLDARGEAFVMAYARAFENKIIVVVVPLGLARNRQTDQPYADQFNEANYIILPAGYPATWTNVLTGDVVSAEKKLFIFDAFKDFPVALFVGEKI